ncbi:MAG: preprotein translocase subunit SecY [Nanoarchaeota archaeon]|nr:preprotein translocase subunit SecY [Nanoarchaeota archaeon]
MTFWQNFLKNLPEVAAPSQKKLAFNEKLKWTLVMLIAFFILGHVPLFGLGLNALQQFEFLSLILGASFGSIISLGIGPIVTASIVLQLLNGSGIVKFDLTTHEGKQTFQGIQKLLAIFFVLFEAAVFVLMGGLSPSPELMGTALFTQLRIMLIFQLVIGGVMIMFMDEVVSKWGIGSGISLFIAAGVSENIMVRLLTPFDTSGGVGYPFGGDSPAGGKLWELMYGLSNVDSKLVLLALAAIVATIVVFVCAVYIQAMKVEIPLSFGRIRGHGIRWPLKFVYTSNIPVILISALFANIQLWAKLLENWGHPILGTFSGNTAATGFVSWIFPQNVVGNIIKGEFVPIDIVHMLAYILILTAGCVLFAWFWVQTSGMDAKAQAKQMTASGLSIPGFRSDERILERLLQRYIGPLTVMGAIAVGLLAALADLSGALTQGTGILLTVMIIYQLYEQIAREHMMDMNPMMRKMMGGN